MSIHYKGKDKYGVTRWDVIVRYRRDGHALRKAFVVKGAKAGARTFEAKKKLELEAGPVAQPVAVPRFCDFCVDVYKPNAELHLKHETWVKRSSQLATLIEFFGDYKLTEIDEKLIDEYKKARRCDGLKRVSVNNELRLLRRVRNFARDERGIPLRNLKIEFFKLGTKRPKVWNDEEVQRLFTKCAELEPELLPLLIFLANTGARRGEALALPWKHVDLERKQIKIWPTETKHDAVDGEQDEGWEPKSRRPREVPIADNLLPWLDGNRTCKWVFTCASTGKRWSSWPQKKYQRVQTAAGLAGGVHTLRHTYASHFLLVQPDMFLLAKILGHTQTRVTELYSHLLPDHLERGRNAVQFRTKVGAADLAQAVERRNVQRDAERRVAAVPRKYRAKDRSLDCSLEPSRTS